jgi:serine/threonine protein phosphatase PrpC
VTPGPFADWVVVGAAEAGSAHRAAGFPSQDRFYHDIFHDVGGTSVLVAAVADGAGSAIHGATGAARALEGFALGLRETLAKRPANGVALADCQGWLRAARRAVLDGADTDGTQVGDFACTLAAAVIADQRMFAVQIGDGIIALRGAGDDRWQLAFWPQKGDHRNETRFLTDEDASTRAMVEVLMSDVVKLAVGTDGIEDLCLDQVARTAFSPFFDALTATVLATPEEQRNDLPEALRRYLASDAVNDRTDDDKTLVLAVRRSDA